MRRIQVLEPMNDVAAASVVTAMAKDAGFEQVVAAVTFTESPVHDDALYASTAKALAQDPNVDGVYLKDPGGLLTPDRIRNLVPPLLAAVGDVPLELHSHCTTGLAPEVYVIAAQLGVRTLHTAIGALSNGTSQPSATRLVENLAAVGIPTDIDPEPLREAERIIDVIAVSQGLEPGRPTELDLAYQKHQIPGGMMGTLRRQLSEIGQMELLPAVLDEVSRVRAALGYPIMVTPYSQFVGSQAVLNVMAGRSGGSPGSACPTRSCGTCSATSARHPARSTRRSPSAPPTTRARASSTSALPEPTLEELRTAVAGRWRERPVDPTRSWTTARCCSAPCCPPTRSTRCRPPARLRSGTPTGPPTCAAPVRSATDFIRAVDALPHWRELEVRLGEEKVRLSRPSGPEDRGRG